MSATNNFTWTKGKHQFKFGANINHVVDVSADTIGGDDPRGTLSFSEAMTSFDGIGYSGGRNSANAPSLPTVGYSGFLPGKISPSPQTPFVHLPPAQAPLKTALDRPLPSPTPPSPHPNPL